MDFDIDTMRPRTVPGNPSQPAGDGGEQQGYEERLQLLKRHVARGRKHADPTLAMLELIEGDFMLIQAALGTALGKRLGVKAPSEDELNELRPLVVDITKVGKTIASLEKMLQRHRGELLEDS